MNFNNFTIPQEQLGEYYDTAMGAVLGYLPNIAGAILTIVVGLKIAKVLQNMIRKIILSRNIDPMVSSFLSSLIGGALKILVFVSAAGILGVKTDSFVAALAAAGLAIGLALSGTLQNFASGIMILVFKRFKKGDYIEIGDIAGSVEEITIFNTILVSPDRKVITMPNSEITTQSVTNYNDQVFRRIDYIIGIGYGDDIKKAKAILQKIAEEEPRVIDDQNVTIGVRELGESSVNLAFRFYVLTENYWPVWFDVLEKVKLEFDANGISIPFPQQDVHHYNHDGETINQRNIDGVS